MPEMKRGRQVFHENIGLLRRNQLHLAQISANLDPSDLGLEQRGGSVECFVNGLVLGADGSRADAVAVHDGVIIGLGDDAKELGGKEVDLEGGLLISGFRDGHAHPLEGGIDLNRCPLEHCSSTEEIVATIGRYAATNPDLPWIVAGPYDPSLLPDGRGDAAWLDAVVSDRPVKLSAADYHTVWVNSRALEIAGIDALTSEPQLGQILRRSDNSPSGMLVEWGAIDLIDRHVPETTDDQRRAGLDVAVEHFLSNGIVWSQDAMVTAADAAIYLEAARQDRLKLDINMAWRADPKKWRDQVADFCNWRAEVDADPAAAGRLTAFTVKFFADGVIEQGTGFVLEPYEVEPHDCGLPNWVPAELAEAVATFAAAGFQIHIHAIGDGGVRMALDAIEHAGRVNTTAPQRSVIAHTQLVDIADRGRFASLGVIANFEPLWARLEPISEIVSKKLGPLRSEMQYPIASLARLGSRISFGSDWPVSSLSPLRGLSVAVTRQMPDGTPRDGWMPEERIKIVEAIRAYTSDVAFQAFDDKRGSISVGQRADFCLLGADITSIGGLEIADVPVKGTWVKGAQVWRV